VFCSVEQKACAETRLEGKSRFQQNLATAIKCKPCSSLNTKYELTQKSRKFALSDNHPSCIVTAFVKNI